MRFKNLHTYYLLKNLLNTFKWKVLLSGLLILTTQLAFTQVCDNVTNGGQISGDESGCSSPLFDPNPIISIAPATGGTGGIEYIWMQTTSDPNSPFNTWQIIPGANGEDYDPVPITQTTYYARCSRRSGCIEYPGETNIIIKEIDCCDFEAAFNPINPTICVGETVMFSITTTEQGLSYAWSASAGNFDDSSSPTPTYTMMMPGTFEITLSISKDDCIEILTTNVTVEPTLQVTAFAQDATCTGINDGSIQLSITDPIGTPTFDWDNGIGNVQSPDNLAEGTYNVTLTNGNGCSSTASFDIGTREAIVVNTVVLSPTCMSAADGQIQVTPQGGTAPYSYNWSSNLPDSNSLSNLVAGLYFVTITDAVGCTAVRDIVLANPDPITISTSVSGSGCGGSTGEAAASVSGGTPPYSYSWNDPANQQSSIATNLSPGTYQVVVTDANGCEALASVIVRDEESSISIILNPLNLSCSGGADGAIMAVVTGGAPPYIFNWGDGFPSTSSLNNLSEGTYTLTVTDSTGCIGVATTNLIAPPPLSISAISTPADCNNPTGSATVTVSGGAPGYSYQWNDSNNQTSQTAVNLAPGNYTVIVTDRNGCSASFTETVRGEGDLLITLNTSSTCDGQNNGSIEAIVTNGVAPFNYQWTNNLGNANAFTGLPAGVYEVTVTDAVGCSGIARAEIKTSSMISVIPMVEAADCNMNNGRVVLDVMGGTPTYTFNWSTGATTSIINGLAIGMYSYTVTDANGCTFFSTIDVNEKTDCPDDCIGGVISTNSPTTICAGDGQPDPIVFNLTGNAGSNTGWVVTDEFLNILEISDTNVFDFENTGLGICLVWSISYQSPISGLEIGQNIANIVGCNGLSNSIRVIREDCSMNCPDISIVSTPRDICPGEAINFGVNSNASDLNYQWSATGGTFDNDTITNPIYRMMMPGVYDIYVVASNEFCSVADTVQVTVRQGPTISFTTTGVTCPNDQDGSIDLEVGNSTGQVIYTWDNGIGNIPNPMNLSAGIYNVTVSDESSCVNTASIEIVSSSNFSVDLVATNLSCNGDTNGSITANVSGGVPPFNFFWSNGAAGASSINNLFADDYTLTITDGSGCTIVASATIETPEASPLSIINTSDNEPVCGGTPVSLSVANPDENINYSWTATGGSFDDASSPAPIYTMRMPGTYIITVTAFDGTCTYTASTRVIIIEGIDFTIIKKDISCDQIDNGAIIINIDRGVEPITYTWDNGIGNIPNPTALLAGTYNVTVTGGNNCSSSATIDLIEIPSVDIGITKLDNLCNGDSAGSILANLTGGTAPFEILWSNGVTNETELNNLEAGTYILTVTDANSCTSITSVEINEPNSLVTTTSTSNISCDTVGNAFVTATGGTPPYTYLWNDSANQTTDTAFNLAMGTYIVTITDANNCIEIDSVILSNSGLLTCEISVLQYIQTVGGNEGHLSANASGESGILTYNWSNGATTQEVSNLGNGSYSVTIVDNNNCSCIANIDLLNPAKVGDLVFEDKNQNGIQDEGEAGIQGIPLQLSGATSNGDALVLQTVSDENGMYMFTPPPGDYKITVTETFGYTITVANQGTDEALDNDINPITLMSEPFTLLSESNNPNIDIGIIIPAGCNNVLLGGAVEGDEVLCGPSADPAPITNVLSPSGGIGVIEYLWLMSNKPDYTPGDPDWVEIPNSNTPDFDPGVINQTTYYIRCSRRRGCDNYPGETAVIQKIVEECADNPIVENLRAANKQNEVELTWEGKIPSTDGSFIIERSLDGTDFKVIDVVLNNSLEEMSTYQFMDKSPMLGENYYRIQAFQPNSEKSISNVVMTKIKMEVNQRVSIYPNPVVNEVTVHFLEVLEEKAILQLINGFGQIMKEIQIETSTKRITIEMSDLPAGMYYFKFDNRVLNRVSQKIYKVEE